MTLVGRVEEYRRPDGTWTTDRASAVRVRPDAIVQAVRRLGTVIAEQYFLGTAKHETNFAVNERDMEAPDVRGLRFSSLGIYQISLDEAHEVGRPSADLLDLTAATWVICHLAEMRRAAIRSALVLHVDEPDPRGLEAYLALAHNQGLRAAQTTIRAHGLDWPGYKARNPTIRIVSSGYGDDCLPRSI